MHLTMVMKVVGCTARPKEAQSENLPRTLTVIYF